jgi:hypothetical protein
MNPTTLPNSSQTEFSNRTRLTQPANIRNSNLIGANEADITQLYRRLITGRYPSPRWIPQRLRLNYWTRRTPPVTPKGCTQLRKSGGPQRGNPAFFPPNYPDEGQTGYGLVNARLTLQSADGRWSGELGGTNLTNKDYRTFAENGSALGVAATSAVFGPPRQWDLRVRAAF